MTDERPARIRLGMVGGGKDAFIGGVHRIASRIDDQFELVAGALDLAGRGVYPFVVPYRPLAGTLAMADGVGAPDPAVLEDVTTRVAAGLRALGMRGADQGAGCAACGACSALQAAGA